MKRDLVEPAMARDHTSVEIESGTDVDGGDWSCQRVEPGRLDLLSRSRW
jgi:hypothetical protein